jgi:hypothetical protein
MDGPKFNPLMVRLLPCEGGKLMPTVAPRKDVTGASYVNVSSEVPTTAMTVKDARYDVPNGVVRASQVTVVVENHVAVVQGRSSK